MSKKIEKQKPKKQLKDNKNNNKEKKDFKNIITKQKLFYLLIIIIDITFIIYCARHNYANYAKDITGEHYFVGDSKDLLFGKNYITIIFSSFVYIYILLANRIFFHEKNSKKYMIGLFALVFLFNIILFFIFTKRIY